jgi:hypothetical protein
MENILEAGVLVPLLALELQHLPILLAQSWPHSLRVFLDKVFDGLGANHRDRAHVGGPRSLTNSTISDPLRAWRVLSPGPIRHTVLTCSSHYGFDRDNPNIIFDAVVLISRNWGHYI